jgi:hypothetical protein
MGVQAIVNCPFPYLASTGIGRHNLLRAKRDNLLKSNNKYGRVFISPICLWEKPRGEVSAWALIAAIHVERANPESDLFARGIFRGSTIQFVENQIVSWVVEIYRQLVC